MTPLNLLLNLASRGVVLVPRDGKLVVDAPVGVLHESDREMLARHKAELLALLIAGAAPDVLPPDCHLLWDERAAIIEYDGKIPRERAEALALTEILGRMRDTGLESPGDTCV
jgi:hypothetical protein